MGKATKGVKQETAEFPSSVYGIIPKALSELSEVIAFIKAVRDLIRSYRSSSLAAL